LDEYMRIYNWIRFFKWLIFFGLYFAY
jgi:hypothetical protein